MITETTKRWITKYALSEGISQADGTSSGDYFHETGRWISHKEGKDAHSDRPDAIIRAEKMRLEKIASLEKQIAKLKRLKFD